MRHNSSILIFIVLTSCIFVGCKQQSVDGVIISNGLYDMQTFSTNRELCSIIKRTLNKDPHALVELNNYWCGGGAGCYDLGFVVTQIIYKVGEKEFINLVQGLSKKEKQGLLSLIGAGLEYGDNNHDGKMDDTTIEVAFPSLNKALNE